MTNSSPKVQIGRMSQELRLSSNSEESEREVATSKSPTHPYAPLLTRGQGIKNLPQIEETMRIDHMADSSGGEMKMERENENGVTIHHATTIKRDTMKQTLNHILPSKSGAGIGMGVGWDGTKLEKSRKGSSA